MLLPHLLDTHGSVKGLECTPGGLSACCFDDQNSAPGQRWLVSGPRRYNAAATPLRTAPASKQAAATSDMVAPTNWQVLFDKAATVVTVVDQCQSPPALRTAAASKSAAACSVGATANSCAMTAGLKVKVSQPWGALGGAAHLSKHAGVGGGGGDMEVLPAACQARRGWLSSCSS